MNNFKLSDEKFKEIFPFSTPRKGQREIIERIISAYENGKKYVILDAPCGIGKSVIGYAVARYFGEAYVLTSQKILQNQYYNDFKMPYVLGRGNYTCKRNENLTCEMGACFRIAKKYCKNGKALTCPYLVARENCLQNPYSNLNYSYFLSISKIQEFIQQRELIICDEAHNLESELIKTSNVHLNDKLLHYIGVSLKMPDRTTSSANKCAWLITDVLDELKSQYAYFKTKISSLSELKLTREYKKISSKYSAIEKLLITVENIKNQIKNNDDSYNYSKIVVTQDEDYIDFKSLYATDIFKSTLENVGNHFLFMSATILNEKVFCKNLGIDKNLTEYISCNSIFPVENRLIHYNPVGSLSFKNKAATMPILIKTIDKLLKKYKNVKGIIHTVNYDIAEKIIEGLRFSDQSYRLLMPRGKEKQMLLDTFYSSKKPYVLISPSLTEGIDLKEDLSRLCIICKVPYLNLTDEWVKKRMNNDPEWYTTSACINIVQMSGRSIRSETDFANTYILDKDFERLAISAVNIFPKWWQESVILQH